MLLSTYQLMIKLKGCVLCVYTGIDAIFLFLSFFPFSFPFFPLISSMFTDDLVLEMVFVVLNAIGEFEGVAKLSVRADAVWALAIESSDGEHSRPLVTVSSVDEEEISGSRGTANFVVSWPGSHNQGWIKVVPPASGDFPIALTEAQQAGQEPIPLVVFECRGVGIVGWHPSEEGGEIELESEGGTLFEEVGFVDGEWADYDEENDLPVSVTNLQFSLALHSEKKGKKGKK